VLAAYGVSLLLLAGLLGLTLWQGARTRRALDAQERRMAQDG
jgi:heme exporter protein D